MPATPLGVHGQNTNIDQTPAVPLVAAATPVRVGVRLKALSTNSGIVYVGNTSAVTTSTGYPLSAGQELPLDVGFFKLDANDGYGDLQNVYVIAGGADNQGVAYEGV